MKRTTKAERKRAKREAPGIARSLGVALTARFLASGAKVLYREDCGHEVLTIPYQVHAELQDFSPNIEVKCEQP
jgi:hypothetical protein